MLMNRWHRTMALVFALPLLLSVVTGLTYRIGRYWFEMSSDTGKIVRRIHEGGFLGETLMPVYVLILGLGNLAILVTGMVLLSRSVPVAAPVPLPASVRFHRRLAVVTAIPFFVTVVTGVAYRLTQAWFGWTPDEAKWLMNLHQGTWLGQDARAYYVLCLGLAMLSLLATGLSLSGLFSRRKA